MTQAQRSARSYLKRKHIAQAELAGAEILDVTVVALAPDGHYVVRLYDNSSLHLTLREEVKRPKPEDPVDEVSARRAARPKRVYAPKSWPAEKWNTVVGQLREQDFTKDEARRELANAKTLDAKQIRHALAVVDAMPDAPDWYAHMPVAEV